MMEEAHRSRFIRGPPLPVSPAHSLGLLSPERSMSETTIEPLYGNQAQDTTAAMPRAMSAPYIQSPPRMYGNDSSPDSGNESRDAANGRRQKQSPLGKEGVARPAVRAAPSGPVYDTTH
jgi:hypothetical protein